MIVGAGHAGLAMSRCLAEHSIDHVLLERGEIAHTWRTERWDLLRLLTPNWQSRLPGFGYDGDDPNGHRTLPQVIDFIESYAKAFSAPELPVLDRKGRVRHDGGIVCLPGAIDGRAFLRRRKSTLIDGAGDDARDLSDHLKSYLDGTLRA